MHIREIRAELLITTLPLKKTSRLSCLEQKMSATDDLTSPAGIEQCPHCGQTFADAVTLVEHVERAHSRKELCVLC